MIRIIIEIDEGKIEHRVESEVEGVQQREDGAEGGAAPEELVRLLGEAAEDSAADGNDGTIADAGGPPQDLLDALEERE